MGSEIFQEVTEKEIEELPVGILELPSFVAIKHADNGHFLAVITEGERAGCLAFKASNNPHSLQSQFAVQKATKPGNAALGDVHLRSLYNGKYWIRASNAPAALIEATSSEPNEESLTPRCTLLRAVTLSPGNLRLLYVSSLNYLGQVEDAPEGGLFLRLRPIVSPNPATECQIVDCATLVQLPKVVAFKGSNTKFLQRSQNQNGPLYNIFQATGVAEQSVFYEIHPTSQLNCVHIKPYGTNKVLKRSTQDWIISSDDSSENDDLNTIFEFVKVLHDGNLFIALRNLGNNLFCKRLTRGELTDSLNATDTETSNHARLEVVEPVVSRTIVVRADDFKLHLASVYDPTTFEMDRKTLSNPDNVPRMFHLVLKYWYTRTNSWDNTEAIKWNGHADFTSDLPCIISESQVVIQGSHQGSYQWGEAVRETPVAPPIYHKVIVAPKSVVNVTLMGKRAKCKVPFSYLQTDLLSDGSNRSYNNDNGLYSGTHVYAYDINEVSEPLA